MQYAGVLIAIAIIASIAAMPPAFADLNNPNCLELGNCPINWQQPLQWLVFPLEYAMGPVIHVLIWGSVLGIIQMNGHNPALTAVAGLVILAGLIGTNVAINSDTAQFIYWGEIAMVVGIGCMIFYLVYTRLR